MSIRSIVRTRQLSAVFSLAVFIAEPTFAADQLDVIVMNNGDRLTGKMKNLEGGVLKLDVNYISGAISIDWSKVARVESSALFLVQLTDGSIHSGKLVTPEAGAGAAGKIEIQAKDQAPLVVDQSEIVRVAQTSESPLERLSGDVSLGLQYSKGNSATQYNIGADLEYQEPSWGGKGSYSSSLSSSTGAPTATRNQVDLGAYRVLRWQNYFYAGFAGFLQSSVQGIQHQTNLAGGLGRFFKNTNSMRFSVIGALGWQGTQYVESAQTEQSQNLAVALILANLDVFSFKKTQLTVNASIAPALTEAGRAFSRLNASYYLKVFGKIDWNLSFYGSWDTKPPAQLRGSDYGTSTGLSYRFGNR